MVVAFAIDILHGGSDPNSVPVAGKFETFHGAFGRQEFNEHNLDEVHRIRQEHQGQSR